MLFPRLKVILVLEGRTLILASVGRKRFIMEAGIKRLSSEEKAKINNIEKFINGDENDEFSVKVGLEKISHEEWEKVKNYDYSVLRNQRWKFIREEGERLVKKEIQHLYKNINSKIIKQSYVYDTPGSLFSNSKIRVDVEFKTLGEGKLIGRPFLITLVKFRTRWAIESAYPPLF